MGRPQKYGEDQILDSASELVRETGLAALSAAGVAARLGAPSGSIYHRFPSRDHLGASLWLRAVESFQDSLVAVLADEAEPAMTVRLLAQRILLWSRENLDDAAILLVHRSSDFLNDGWPPELRSRNESQRERTQRLVSDLCEGLGATTDEARLRVRFATIDLPYAAARSSLSQGKAPPPELDAIVDDAVVAVLAGIQSSRSSKRCPAPS